MYKNEEILLVNKTMHLKLEMSKKFKIKIGFLN